MQTIRFHLGHISVQDLIPLVTEVESEGAWVEIECEYEVVAKLVVHNVLDDPDVIPAARATIEQYVGEVEEEEVG